MHARNAHQVLGQDLESPSLCVICWTPKGELKGGTRTAIVIAEQNDIPVFNFGKGGTELTRLGNFLREERVAPEKW